MKIIVSAGGTGGHIYPALAIIKKFQEKEKNLEEDQVTLFSGLLFLDYLLSGEQTS